MGNTEFRVINIPNTYLSDEGYVFPFTLEARGTLPVEECHICHSKGIMEYKIITPHKTYAFCKKCRSIMLKLIVILDL